jgi:hypothetical protein
MPVFVVTYEMHTTRAQVVGALNVSEAIKAADELMRLNEENGSETESDWKVYRCTQVAGDK